MSTITFGPKDQHSINMTFHQNMDKILYINSRVSVHTLVCDDVNTPSVAIIGRLVLVKHNNKIK